MRVGRTGTLTRLVTAVLAASMTAACEPPDPAPGTRPAPLVLGAADSLLFWEGEAQLDGYRHIDSVFPTRVIRAGPRTRVLRERRVDLSGFTFSMGPESYDIDRFMEENHIVGLLVLDDGEIVLERYERGNGPDTKWVSYSISKSVVSLLVGAALKDGYIRSLDDSVADYLPMLRGSSYEPVTIRHALQMASGVSWNDGYEDYDGDINRSVRMGTLDLLRMMARRDRVAEPGARWNYNSGETHLLGTALRAAIGNNLSEYFSSKIWRPFGMASDAHWLLVEPGGGEHGGCCFSATLRDYGRLGLFAMEEGALPDGTSALPEGWIEESTAPSPGNPGYGYLWWLQPGGAYAAIGIFGQMIWIDPAEEVVVVTHSAWPAPTPYFVRGYAFARAIRDAL